MKEILICSFLSVFISCSNFQISKKAYVKLDISEELDKMSSELLKQNNTVLIYRNVCQPCLDVDYKQGYIFWFTEKETIGGACKVDQQVKYPALGIGTEINSFINEYEDYFLKYDPGSPDLLHYEYQEVIIRKDSIEYKLEIYGRQRDKIIDELVYLIDHTLLEIESNPRFW